MNSAFLIVIPARLNSSRLPRKMLADIEGKPMVQWVYEACKKAGSEFRVEIGVDSLELLEVCRSFGADVIMTSIHHESGSARCLEVWNHLQAQGHRFAGLINVQGDEPFLEPTLLQEMGAALLRSEHTIVTAASPISTPQELPDPNCVKVGFNKNTLLATYFSREVLLESAPNKIQEEDINGLFYKHLGIYGFPSSMPIESILGATTPNSKQQRLEQLAWMDAGIPIEVIPVSTSFGGVDSAEDLLRARAYAALQGKV